MKELIVMILIMGGFGYFLFSTNNSDGTQKQYFDTLILNGDDEYELIYDGEISFIRIRTLRNNIQFIEDLENNETPYCTYYYKAKFLRQAEENLQIHTPLNYKQYIQGGGFRRAVSQYATKKYKTSILY